MFFRSIFRRTELIAFSVASVLFFLLVIPCSGQETEAKPVKLIIDFGDGVEKHFTRLPWTEGQTVMDVMMAAREHPRGIEFEHRGRGSTAFLFQIDDVKNERQGRSWIYRVNDKLADRSIGIYRIEAGDTILWKFEVYR